MQNNFKKIFTVTKRKYINKKDVIDIVINCINCFASGYEDEARELAESLLVKFTEIGKCGNCKYWLEDKPFTPCELSGRYMIKDGFCDEFEQIVLDDANAE